MAAKPPENRCAVADCVKGVMVGQLVCQEHRPKPLTLRERIEKGPKFDPTSDVYFCLVCGGDPPKRCDRTTALCIDCFRAWRWSAIREYEQPR